MFLFLKRYTRNGDAFLHLISVKGGAIFTPQTQASEVKTSLSSETESRKHPGKKGLVKISTAWSTVEIE